MPLSAIENHSADPFVRVWMGADACSVSLKEFDDLEDCSVSTQTLYETPWESLTGWRVQAGFGPDQPSHPARLLKSPRNSNLDISRGEVLDRTP